MMRLKLAIGLVLLLVGCNDSTDAVEIVRPVEIANAVSPAPATTARANQKKIRVVARYPHDPQSFTQGLLEHNGWIYESTGMNGQSTLRRYRLGAKKTPAPTKVDAQYFAEGLALVDQRLIQLTWRSQIALLYDAKTLRPVGTWNYQGEGWGLCFNGEQLVMSDGTSTLAMRNPQDFSVVRRVAVTLEGQALPRLNELECVGQTVYANVWQTDQIVEIDPQTGHVLSVIDASALLSAEERSKVDVLNGIAYLPKSGHYLLTGKYWPWIFEVEFVD